MDLLCHSLFNMTMSRYELFEASVKKRVLTLLNPLVLLHLYTCLFLLGQASVKIKAVSFLLVIGRANRLPYTDSYLHT